MVEIYYREILILSILFYPVLFNKCYLHFLSTSLMNTLEFTWICLAFLSLTENVWTERKSSNAKSFAKFVKKAPWKKNKYKINNYAWYLSTKTLPTKRSNTQWIKSTKEINKYAANYFTVVFSCYNYVSVLQPLFTTHMYNGLLHKLPIEKKILRP